MKELKCTCCKRTLPLECFYSDNSRTKRGYDYYCKECKYRKGVEYKINNPDKFKRWQKAYRLTRNEKQRKYYSDNHEGICEYRRGLYKKLKIENPEKLKRLMREHGKKYKENSPMKYAFNYYKKNAKSRDIKFDLTFDEFLCFEKLPCAYCGDIIDTIGIDRIDNSNGYVKGNMAPCCRVCNVMKSDYTTDYFLSHCKKIYLKNIPPPKKKEKKHEPTA